MAIEYERIFVAWTEPSATIEHVCYSPSGSLETPVFFDEENDPLPSQLLVPDSASYFPDYPDGEDFAEAFRMNEARDDVEVIP